MNTNMIFGLIVIVLACGMAVYEFIRKVKYISTLEGQLRWDTIVEEVEKLIVEAEGLYHYGRDKKQWVLQKIEEKIRSFGFEPSDELMEYVDEAIESLVDRFNEFKKGTEK